MSGGMTVAPVRVTDRIAVIDVLRGFAILGILHLNMPLTTNIAWEIFADPRNIGWTQADQWSWAFAEIFTGGTMRGSLQLLFGAGLMLLAAKAMEPDGPVAVADVWYRRNFWLMAFGAFNAIVLLFPGDILFAYAFAAIFIFPFRKLKARWLLVISLGYLVFTAYQGFERYSDEVEFKAEVEDARALEAAGAALDEDARKAIASWENKIEKQGGNPKFDELTANQREVQADPVRYLTGGLDAWSVLWKFGVMRDFITEAFFIMLMGMALYKLGFIQGNLSVKTYLIVMIAGYAFGWGVRYAELIRDLTFTPIPDPSAPFGGFPRVAISLGHIALINLLMKTRAEGVLGSTLGQAGRLAFTLYLMQSLIQTYVLSAPWGLGMFENTGWARILWVSAIIMALQIAFAAWWTRHFRFGPLEWIWRSLTHWKLQPMRVSPATASQPYGPQP